ncbi:MAG: hypothetical protein U0164_20795 [Gemmatimonadaceae bacterium]
MMTRNAALVSHYGNIIRLARDLAREAEKQPLKSIAAIIMSAASVEGFINELLEELQFELHGSSSSKMPRKLRLLARLAGELDQRNASVALKLQLYVGCLRTEPWDTGHAMYQDLDLLLKLRNALVHSRPERLSIDDLESSKRQPLVERLHSRVPLRIVPQREPLVRMLGPALVVQQPEVAQWAFATAERTCLALAECMPRGLRRTLARAKVTGERVRGTKPVPLPD